jgi:DNA-binding transcriptional MerR regulator
MAESSGNAHTRAEKAFAFYASLPPEQRQYAAVAEHFGVSLATVRLWGSKGNWRRRVLEKEIETVRKAADRVQATEMDTRTKHGKLVELGLVKLATAIAREEVKPTYGDLDRLVRLEGSLKGNDRVLPMEEVRRILRSFLRAIEEEIHEPEQLSRIADALWTALDAAEGDR